MFGINPSSENGHAPIRVCVTPLNPLTIAELRMDGINLWEWGKNKDEAVPEFIKLLR